MSGDVSKLPKWARDKIGGLERDVERLTKRLADVPEDGAVAFTDGYGFMTGRRRPVAKRHEAVRFYLTDDTNSRADYIEITANRGYIDISCDQRIVIIGQASNCLTAETRPR